MITLRPMTEDDFARFWPTYRTVVAAQETYALDPAPTFDAARALWLDALYGNACAKCHGADLEGNTAPALSGPSFAPLSHSHLTIGGVFGYMATNMPADQPGKLKDEEYADLMAFLLASNGYVAGKSKLTADTARASTAPLVVGPAGHQAAGQ
ncbi:hypothetical protein CA831_21050 [Burkholderia multivorans]|nr:hypothetical protein CA831_21050 [Burkholderia multivorans]